MAVGMVAFSVIPTAFGWTTSVVVSGSMTPAVRVGDVVSAAPIPAGSVQGLNKGTVILMDNPAQPGKLLLHRLVRHQPDGTLITKGDANDHEDSSPVPPQNVKGVARLRVPMIGLPVVWAKQRLYPPLIALVVLLGIVLLWHPQPRDD